MSGPEDMVIEVKVSGGVRLPLKLVLRHDTVAMECTSLPMDYESSKAMLRGLATVVYTKLMDFAEGYETAEVVELNYAEHQTVQ